MTTAQVVKTSVTVNNNSPIQDYVHLDDQTQPTFEETDYLYTETTFHDRKFTSKWLEVLMNWFDWMTGAESWLLSEPVKAPTEGTFLTGLRKPSPTLKQTKISNFFLVQCIISTKKAEYPHNVTEQNITLLLSKCAEIFNIFLISFNIYTATQYILHWQMVTQVIKWRYRL